MFGNESCGCVSYLSDLVCWSVLMFGNVCSVVASHICLILCVGVC